MKLKVMTIVGTRPELIKLSRVIAELDVHTEHTLVHTGQNYDYELYEIFFQELGIRPPDHFLGVADKNPAASIGNIITRADEVMEKVAPDALLLYGDTNSCLSIIPAKRRKIPVFHMEGGNRCFDQRVPEELNRKVVDHLADINMTLTEHARRYLLAEGIRPETVIKVGSSMKEVIGHHRAKIEASDVLTRLGIEAGKYVVVSAHREENIDPEPSFQSLLASVRAVAAEWGHPVIFSTHPRTRKRLESLGGADFGPLVRFLKPLGFLDYIKLQTQALCVVSDSGTITEEASLLGFPAVTIRQAHERPEGMDAGTLIMTGLDPARVLDSIRVVTSQAARQRPGAQSVADYETDTVSTKVVRIILSYTEYVNRTVWFRSP